VRQVGRRLAFGCWPKVLANSRSCTTEQCHDLVVKLDDIPGFDSYNAATGKEKDR
jgi:hypothetical protein